MTPNVPFRIEASCTHPCLAMVPAISSTLELLNAQVRKVRVVRVSHANHLLVRPNHEHSSWAWRHPNASVGKIKVT